MCLFVGSMVMIILVLDVNVVIEDICLLLVFLRVVIVFLDRLNFSIWCLVFMRLIVIGLFILFRLMKLMIVFVILEFFLKCFMFVFEFVSVNF